MTKYPAENSIAKKAMKKAIRPMIRDFGELENLQSSSKPLEQFCAASFDHIYKKFEDEFDYAAEDYGLFIDGKALKPSAEFNFHVNLMDGINNYVRSIPFFSLTVSLEKVENDGSSQKIFTLSESPILGEVIYAEKASGAFVEKSADGFMKEIRLRMAMTRKMNKAIVVFGDLSKVKKGKLFAAVVNNNINFLALGSDSLAMNYVASGKADVAITGTNDFELFAKESGGFVFNQDGEIASERTGPFIATNEYLIKDFMRMLTPKK